MKALGKNRGITLISLVVTIIILLILAGVSIATLTGNNGLLTRASESKTKTEEAQEKEGVELAVTSSQMDDPDSLEITKQNLQNAIDNQFGTSKATVTDNGDGSFTIKFDDTDRMYYVENFGKVIQNDNILRISTSDELKSFRDDVNHGNTYEDWYIYLANDITLDINEEWEPIGLYPSSSSGITDKENNKPFKGIFDGRGCKIDGIYINTTDRGQGLFGLVEKGTIKNLGIGNSCSISGGAATGAIVGYLYNNSQVINSYNQSNVYGGTYVGGIVGFAYSEVIINNCYNIGKISTTTGAIRWNCWRSEWCYNKKLL